ncbi:MAG: quinol:cytochrome C oxidoreductase [Planctomycetota bacterium]|nr:quinol:cytochrome C oxidoreductase [Planctomycetota bacterium]
MSQATLPTTGVSGPIDEAYLTGASSPLMKPDNIYLPAGAGAGAARGLLGLGLFGFVVLLVAAFAGFARHALAAYHVAIMTCLAISLGAMFLVMTWHLFAAGWSVSLRRQAENLMRSAPIFGALALVTPLVDYLFLGGKLFTWMNPKFAQEYVLLHKAPWLNAPFFFFRGVIYVVVWAFISNAMWTYSRTQDQTGDRWLTNKARKTSTFGMVLFALSTAFAAFDWLMSVDYKMFSTMWGVAYFAAAIFSAIATLILVIAILQGKGLLKGVVTHEHYHDAGKLLFSFTVFWAYINFSQYFLIWYSNIPEETRYYLYRQQSGWEILFYVLCIGHFFVPFLFLIFRGVKRSRGLLMVAAVWGLFVHVVDIAYIIRPMVYAGVPADQVGSPALWILDIIAIVAGLAVFSGLLIPRISSGPLVPLRDPRMHECLAHKNYV